ncbi:MAG TPA: hypothetical protein ENH29_10590 [Bacteroidetes bacterium]|nr:hypothetical protein [Bacteroidota bacterium]
MKTGDGEYKFAPEFPLPGLSLVAGKYVEKSISVDSVDYHVYFLKGHDYFAPYLSEIDDTLAALIRENKKDYEVDLDLPYLYPDLNLVETPIQLFSYKRFWTEAQETVQPEMVLLPELGILLSSGDFKQFLSWQERRQKRSNVVETPREIQSNMFQRFVRDTFLGGQGFNRFRGNVGLRTPVYYKIFPNYFTFVNYIDAPKWPIFNVAMESYLSSKVSVKRSMGFRFNEGLSSQEKTNIELSEKSLPELLADPDKKEVIPDIIKEKGAYLFTLLQSRLGEEKFPGFLSKILSENHFKSLNVDQIISTLKKEFNFNLTPYVENWYASKKLPGFLIGDIKANQVLDGERTRYQVRFKISNIESVAGLVEVSFRMGGRGRFGMGGSSDNEVKRIINMEGNQNKEIGIILDYQPRVMTVNTFISRNLPATMTKMFIDLKLAKNVKLFDGEKIVDSPVELQTPDEIIVDNEDPGFETFSTTSESFIKKLFKISNSKDNKKYIGLTFWRPPKQWRATIHANFYGRLVKSGYFIRSGDGSKKVAWNAKIPTSGYYDIYYYASKISMPWMRRGGDKKRRPESEQYHFKIYHDDGEDDTILNMGNAENDWVFLGSYYISAGDAKVELTNESKARIVYADAVKWVKRQ